MFIGVPWSKHQEWLKATGLKSRRDLHESVAQRSGEATLFPSCVCLEVEEISGTDLRAVPGITLQIYPEANEKRSTVSDECIGRSGLFHGGPGETFLP